MYLEDMQIGNVYGEESLARDGNIFLGLIDNIMSGNGEVINNILKNSLKFQSKKMELDEINKILVQVTRSCTMKLYHEECGKYSLKKHFEVAEVSPSIHNIALNNITYAVMTAISPIILGSLFYFFSQDFIYFHIRDGIVEPNYRKFIKEAREIYEVPSEQEHQILTLRKFKAMVESLSETFLVDPSNASMEYLEKDLTALKEIIPSIQPDQAKSIIDTEIKYPIPGFIYDIVCDNIKENTNSDITNFIQNLNLTFTINGLRKLYKEYGGIKSVGETFDMKITKLHKDRLFASGVNNPIDGITLEQNITLSKLIAFNPLSEKDEDNIKDSVILTRIKECIENYPAIGTKVELDNDKITVTSGGVVKDFHYQSNKIDDEIKSPFIIFGARNKSMETIYYNEPEKFCGNQAIMTRKDKSALMMDGKREPSSIAEKTMYNNRRLRQLLNNRDISRNGKLMAEINDLRTGQFETLKHINQNWFGNIVVDDPKRAVLILAEMEGLRSRISKALIEESKMPKQYSV